MMRPLSMEDLTPVVGVRAAEKILKAFPSLWVQEEEAGDVATAEAFRVQEPWDEKKITLQFLGRWLTLPIETSIQGLAVSAVAQAQLEGRALTVRVHEGFIVEIWLA